MKRNARFDEFWETGVLPDAEREDIQRRLNSTPNSNSGETLILILAELKELNRKLGDRA